MTTQQIIAMGGGGFSQEPHNLALDRYILEQAHKPDPSVTFLGQASGDSDTYITNYYTAFRQLGCRPSHLSLFKPHTADLEGFLMEQDVIYVGGGNTRSMLALWREWEVDIILRNALEAGIVLAGISAGAICWFRFATTDSIPFELNAIACLGFIDASCSPHYDHEHERRPRHHELLKAGKLTNGYGLDEGAALHFVDGQILRAVASRPDAQVYRVELEEGEVTETVLPIMRLSPYRP